MENGSGIDDLPMNNGKLSIAILNYQKDPEGISKNVKREKPYGIPKFAI
jgi:hypothetical protein